MVEHDGHVGQLLKKLDDLGIAREHHRPLHHRQRCRGDLLARRRQHALPRREGRPPGRAASACRPDPLAGRIQPGTVINDIVSHAGLAADAAGRGRRAGDQAEAAGRPPGRRRTYRVHLRRLQPAAAADRSGPGAARGDLLLRPTTATSPRCATGPGRSTSWCKRTKACGVWERRFTPLRMPMLFNLRSDPYERADESYRLRRVAGGAGLRLRSGAGLRRPLPGDVPRIPAAANPGQLQPG